MITSMVTLMLLPMIIKRLGLELYGVVSLTLLFSGVSSIVDLGLSKSIVLLSGEKKISSNKVFTSALIINIIIVALLTVVFLIIQLLGVDLLGGNINLSASNKFVLLNVGFLILIITLLNNVCRAVLEANYLMHIVNIGFALYTPLLYLIIYVASFFTNNMMYYIIIPLFVTLLLFVFYFLVIKLKTSTRLTKVKKKHVQYVFKNTLSFLNVGLVNSMVTPVLRYLFVLVVADVSMYAIFDLSFKIALIANSVIVSVSMPMFAVFSNKTKDQKKDMLNISYKIFVISVILYACILVGYHTIGEQIISFLNLKVYNSKLLYSMTYVLLGALGSIAIVEVFFRYLLGNKMLKQAFYLKFSIPIVCFLMFYVFYSQKMVNRFIYSYGVSLIVCAVSTFLYFTRVARRVSK